MSRTHVVLFALLALSCKDSGVTPTSQDIGEVVLETEFTNWAWGFQYMGTVVFEDGNAHTYNPGNDTMDVLHHADEFYTGTELRAKYSHSQVLIRTVRSDTVSLIRRLAAEVTTGEFSDTAGLGADMGSLVYSVYIYRPESAKFERLILKLEGDWTFYNKSRAAIALVSLMKRL